MSEVDASRKLCTQCATEVTSLALICPNCKHELVAGSQRSQERSANFWSSASRPRWVSILTIYFAIFAGLLPIIATLALFRSNEVPAFLETDSLSVMVSILLGSGVIASAIGAWRGNNHARIVFLILISVHYLLVALNGLSLFTAGVSLNNAQETRVVRSVFRGILYPVITIWLLTRPQTVAFFKPKPE